MFSNTNDGWPTGHATWCRKGLQESEKCQQANIGGSNDILTLLKFHSFCSSLSHTICFVMGNSKGSSAKAKRRRSGHFVNTENKIEDDSEPEVEDLEGTPYPAKSIQTKSPEEDAEPAE